MIKQEERYSNKKRTNKKKESSVKNMCMKKGLLNKIITTVHHN